VFSIEPESGFEHEAAVNKMTYRDRFRHTVALTDVRGNIVSPGRLTRRPGIHPKNNPQHHDSDPDPLPTRFRTPARSHAFYRAQTQQAVPMAEGPGQDVRLYNPTRPPTII
jgi:hypothetical protein